MKLQKTILLSVLAVAFAASAFAQTPAKRANPAPKAPAAPAVSLPTRVVLDTSMGRITCEFFPKQAPLAVANFIGLAKGTKAWVDPVSGTAQHNKPYYNGTIFHRVIPGFMVQGGDPTGTGMGNPGYMFADEFDPSLNFDVPGRLAMANSGPNTNGSQFFITEQAYASLNQHYTIFGQCTDASVLVVKAITGVPRDDRDKPLTPVVLKKVTIVRPGQRIPPDPNAAPQPASKPASSEPSGQAVSSPEKHYQRFTDVASSEAEDHIISKQSPIYPEEAKNAHVSGVVTVAILIGPDGAVNIARAIDGPEVLRTAAEQAVRAWRYNPFFIQGQPEAVQTKANVIFNLD